MRISDWSSDVCSSDLEIRTADYFGLAPREPDFDFKAVMKRIRTIIEVIEPADSVERYTGLGVDVRLGYAQIVEPCTVEIDGTERLTGADERGVGTAGVMTGRIEGTATI